MAERRQDIDYLKQAASEKVIPFYRSWGIVHETPYKKGELVSALSSFFQHGIVPGDQLESYGVSALKTYTSPGVYARQVRFDNGFHAKFPQPSIVIMINPNYFWTSEHETTGSGESTVYISRRVIEPDQFQGIIIDGIPRKPTMKDLPSKIGGYEIRRKVDVAIDDIERQIAEIKAEPFYEEQSRIVKQGMTSSGFEKIGMSEEDLKQPSVTMFYLYREGVSPPYHTINEDDGRDSVLVFYLSDDPKNRHEQLYNLIFLSHLETCGQLNERGRATLVEYYNWLAENGIFGESTRFLAELGIPNKYATKKELLPQQWLKRVDNIGAMKELTSNYEGEMRAFNQALGDIESLLSQTGLAIPVYSRDGSLLWPDRLTVQEIIKRNRPPT